MANQDILEDYAITVRELKKQCLESGMTETEFKKIYLESIKSFEKDSAKTPESKTTFLCLKKYIITFLSIALTLIGVYNFKNIYSCIVCNLQEFIYPGLLLLRKISIPLISLFPSLTAYYHENCLVQNPFFTIVDMDCWPCSVVSDVREISDPKPIDPHQRAPFIYETEQEVVSIEYLKVIYEKNKKLLDNESPKVLTNDKYYSEAADMFQKKKNFYIWKFSSVAAAKVLRQIIPRPKIVPKFGQSIERFIIVDQSHQSFNIPDTECSSSFMLSLSGSRFIELVPAEECKLQCKTLKVELKETYLLWYNWWYWKPKLLHSKGNSTFVAHVGSYC